MVRFFGGALLPLMGCFPLSAMTLGFFPWSREKRCGMMEVYASGFAGHQGSCFISYENALGMMTGWRTLMGIPNDKVFSPNAKGFSLNSVHGSRMGIFCGFYAKGQDFVHIRLR
jgi:hypothetical protein